MRRCIARPQAVAALLRYFRDLDLAEEAFQDACLRALKNWPKNGPPRDPAAWLIMVGRNAALDVTRRRAKQTALPDEDQISDLSDVETPMVERLDEAIIAMMCCGCCSSAAIRTCRRRSKSRWRCASFPG
jgi:RNA polymerase sigma-70 factor (ECF subfamily)